MMWILIRRVATTFVPLAARVASTSGVCRHDCEIFNTEISVGFTLSKHELFERFHAVLMHEPASGRLRAQTPPRATRSLRGALITARS